MRECKNCKTMLEDDELFCHECGTKQDIEVVETLAEEQTALEEKKCIHCGELIEADSMFCPFCGKSQAVEEEKSEVPQQVNELEQPQTVEESVYEEEEKKKSKAWLWILLILLIVGGAGWYYFANSPEEQMLTETPVEKETISETLEVDLEKEKMQSFVKEFYMHYLDESYLRDNVTENVLKKLKRDYPYECEEGDCLATWVFSAYPHGTNMELEEGPVIKGERSPFRVNYKYSYMKNGQKYYEDRSIIIWVNKNGSRYKVFSYDYDDKTQAPRFDEEKLISEIPEGKYNLYSTDMHVILNVHDSEVEGEYNFHAGSHVGRRVKLYGRADNGLQLHLRQRNATNEDDCGFMDGTFDGKTFKGEYDLDDNRVKFEVYVNE